MFVGTFPVLDSEKEAYPILGVNGLFGNGENLIRLISSYPFLQYVWIGPKSDKVEFQHRLDSTHGAAMRSMATMGPGIVPQKEILKKNKNLFSQLVVLSALDITTNCVCHSNFLPTINFQKDGEGPNFANNAGVFNELLLSDGITVDDQLQNLKTIEPTKENMKKIHMIGLSGDYACNVSILAKNITDQLTKSEVELYLDEGRLGLLNASLFNIVQRIWKIKKTMLAGVFDNWHEQFRILGPKGRFKDYMFINELVLLWPLVCSSSLFKTLYIDGELDLVFKGSAAQSFRKLVKALGFTPNTYPFFDEGDRTLRWWSGPVYEFPEDPLRGNN